MRHAIAVDGGNSKTDVALVREDGAVIATARGAGSSPYHLGVEGSLDVIDELLSRAGAALPVAVAELLLAGVDFPAEEQAVRDGIERRGWANAVSVDNDTFAVLRAGTDAGWGVAVVCGAGINCVGVAPDGRIARFRALGWTTGDWGGGGDVGREAVSAAARSADGRGPKTELERLVPAFFDLTTPDELAEAFHFQRIDSGRTIELAPLVLATAADDAVAAGIVDRLASEIAALARAAIARLGLESEPVEVLLGGGLLQEPTPGLLAAIRRELEGVRARPTAAAPVVGAALLALDRLSAEASAYARAREELRADPTALTVGGADG
jgi:N-acetylglucosamine kinase-like BadF-type ATPase